MNVSRTILAQLLFPSLALIGSQAAAADPYFRFPAIRGENIVFTAEGDLWRTSLAGGKATRLTTHPSSETQAAISHDGKYVAFAASYEGAQEAYVMPLEGGQPKRITFENGGVNVLGWTAQGEVLVSTENSVGPSKHRIVAALDPIKMTRRVLPLADANDAVLSDDGRFVFFTRMGLSMTNDNVKAYRGGAHAQLWRYQLGQKGEAVRLFQDDASNNRRAMWWQGRLYFISDADGADNIWSALPDGSDRKVHTRHREWDVRTAALGDGRIAYQLGADLRIFDIASGSDTRVEASLVSDFDQQRTRRVRSPLDALTNIDLASKAERIVLTARGKVTIAGTGSYRRVEIAVPEGARARGAVFSHDDKWVYAFVDTTGENEIWRYAADGSGKGERLTIDGASHRSGIYPSPDGRWLAHTDKKGRTWLLDLQARTNVIIDDAKQVGADRPDQVVWSPDSRNLAFVRVGSSEQRNQIGMYHLPSKTMAFVTTDRYTADSPVFSPDGKWLYFLSSRHFNVGNAGPWGDRNMGPVFDRRVGIYALALQPGVRFPFKPEDELTKPEVASPEAAARAAVQTPGKEDADKSAAIAAAAAATAAANAADDARGAKPKAAPTPAIDYAGLRERLYEVPVAPGNYRALAVDDKRLYILESDNGRSGALKTLEISRSSPALEVFVNNVREFGLSLDRKHIFYRSFHAAGPGEMLIVAAGAKAPADLSKARVKIDDWAVSTNPRLEWKQMFNDAWRMHRDFLYDANMRGVDWVAVRKRYAPLVERVTDRAELDDVLGMMVGEVGALHSQIRPGDVRRAGGEGVPSSLGAVLSRVSDGFRVDRIYRSEPELPSERGPLSAPDVAVKEGDIITAVNGKDLGEARDIADLLLDQADKQVLLHVKSAKGDGKPRPVIVTPVNMARHASLRYSDWEQSRAQQADQASKGKIGYLHLRAMTARDINAFARDFYANINKEGLIIDVRRNNGGNIDSWIIEKLLRRSWAFWSSNGNMPQSNMQNTFRGHLVVLMDELTYSDGETFAAGVKALKLGPLVGKRTAGAGVWLSDGNGLADNGMARVAEFGQFGADGDWLIEGVGVTPDVEVDNLPNETFEGRDRQLEVAIELLEKKMKEQPVKPWKPAAIPALKRQWDAGEAAPQGPGAAAAKR